jgi:hypothetical protein
LYSTILQRDVLYIIAEGRVLPGTKLTKVDVDPHILGHVSRRGPIARTSFSIQDAAFIHRRHLPFGPLPN